MSCYICGQPATDFLIRMTVKGQPEEYRYCRICWIDRKIWQMRWILGKADYSAIREYWAKWGGKRGKRAEAEKAGREAVPQAADIGVIPC